MLPACTSTLLRLKDIHLLLQWLLCLGLVLPAAMQHSNKTRITDTPCVYVCVCVRLHAMVRHPHAVIRGTAAQHVCADTSVKC